jgi:hypothetical protein
MMMRYIISLKIVLVFAVFQFHLYARQPPIGDLQLSKDSNGIAARTLLDNGNESLKNSLDDTSVLGFINLKYQKGTTIESTILTRNLRANVITRNPNQITISYSIPNALKITEDFKKIDNSLFWDISFNNNSGSQIVIKDFAVQLPFGKMNKQVSVADNLSTHSAVIGNGSFLYWLPYRGEGNILVMTMIGSTSLEFYNREDFNRDYNEVFIHAATAMDTKNDTWRIPATSVVVPKNRTKTYGFRFQTASNFDAVREILFAAGSLDVRVVPGMVVPSDLSVTCAIRAKENINKLAAEYPNQTEISYIGPAPQQYKLYKLRFKKPGENLITVQYGKGKKTYLNFFSTEPLEALIRKRSHFITTSQQIRDTSKWYDGLYSIWDMAQQKLLNPDDKGPLPDFVVGGSDDPSNCKPLYVSEKNVVYPDSAEIASLEYYEKKFVWGGLQRKDDEYPYPYGIYGSENWYENRSGKVAGYNSGGWGKERMWRTFDYTTHFALYYNLYKIATNNPHLVHYLDADGYLERAYRTAKAYFEVPYNIKMGEKWSFHGWTDWAYKQGNFHERYLIEIMAALREHGEFEKADILRREWEKKVKYFIYDDPWPFASEFDIDRTAFESTYYVAEYAREHPMLPQEQLWYDKNKQVWYSHLKISDSAEADFMERQLKANLALRGVIEPAFNLLGTSWTTHFNLEYMSQMAGVAILDYALKFSSQPATYVNIGYNSLLSSWALMNTGDEKNGYGYWYPGIKNDGAVGWAFTPWQHTVTYFDNIPSKRWIWQYDGEIDHGLVGGIHGSESIIITDPVFGVTGYGCEVEQNNETGITNVIPRDGVRQKLYVRLSKHNFSLTLHQDGFLKNYPIQYSGDNASIGFAIENRQNKQHECLLSFSTLTPGTYKIYSDNKLTELISITPAEKAQTVKIPISGSNVKVTIEKVQ